MDEKIVFKRDEKYTGRTKQLSKTKRRNCSKILISTLIMWLRQESLYIVLVKKETKECVIIDITVPGNVIVKMKAFEKIDKYRNLWRKVRRLWNSTLNSAWSGWGAWNYSHTTWHTEKWGFRNGPGAKKSFGNKAHIGVPRLWNATRPRSKACFWKCSRRITLKHWKDLKCHIVMTSLYNMLNN